jgi:hypothetical protein
VGGVVVESLPHDIIVIVDMVITNTRKVFLPIPCVQLIRNSPRKTIPVPAPAKSMFPLFIFEATGIDAQAEKSDVSQ